jgi:hypothetical protein
MSVLVYTKHTRRAAGSAHREVHTEEARAGDFIACKHARSMQEVIAVIVTPRPTKYKAAASNPKP